MFWEINYIQKLTGGCNMNRRSFLKHILIGGAMMGVGSSVLSSTMKKGLTKITILHTNDTHSQIEAFPSTHHRFPDMGGFARRAALVKKIREEEKNVMLFDAGDIYQGTPYFNFFKGELEIKLMSEMGYTAATIGNHEFDNGLEGIDRNLQYANFPFISSNYDFSETILKDKVLPYKIFEVDNVRVGVFGLGIELRGLVARSMYGATKYLCPIEKAAEYSYLLKNELKCDLVICVSHLGFSYRDDKVSDVVLAKQSKNIDLIIGGHTHTTLKTPVVFQNSDRKEITIGQVGYAGVHLGRIDVYLSKRIGLKYAEGHAINILKKQV
jgi:5'-nucleotidase